MCFELENTYKSKHIAAPNEGVAVSLGVGYNLKTNKIPIIYLQNSGFGNAINPLISIADKRVFKIPLFLIMGWRGETGKMIADEPQHQTQGEITTSLLRSLTIKYTIIDKKSDFKNDIKKLKNYSKNHVPVCLLVRKIHLKKE